MRGNPPNDNKKAHYNKGKGNHGDTEGIAPDLNCCTDER
jgi:hypothetical protein